MLEKFVKAFFAEDRRLLGISITQEGMVECILFNPKTSTVDAYKRAEVVFNPVKKMVEEMEDLSKTLETLISEMGIKPKTPVVVNLPNFYFGFTEVDAYTQTDEDVRHNILAEIEQSYMFKQYKPVLDYCKVKYSWTQTAKAAFCAAQRNVIEELKGILDELDLVPIAFENSNASILKSLQYFHILDKGLQSSNPWGIVLVNQNSYSIFSLIGDNITDMTEDAVAIKTYEKNEVNYAVASVISTSLQELNFESVILVNNSNDCDAEELGKYLKDSYPNISIIENNGSAQVYQFKTSSKVDSTDVEKITLFAIGAALYDYDEDFLLKFNLGKEVAEEDEEDDSFKLAGVPIELSDVNCCKLLLLAMILPALICGSLFAGATFWNNALIEETTSLRNAAEEAKRETAEKYTIQEEKIEFNPWEEINKVMESNIYNQKCYESLSVNIPKSIWLTYFYNNTYKATIIRGNTKDSNDIYQFFRDLKKRLNDKDLILSKISVSPYERDTYEFEITNKTYLDLVEIIKDLDSNKDYKALITKQQEKQMERYRSSIFPLYPAADLTLKSPAMNNELEQDFSEEIKKLQELDKAPKTLPPT